MRCINATIGVISSGQCASFLRFSQALEELVWRRRAREHGGRRRERNDEARLAFERFLEAAAVPIVRQVVSVLRAEGYLFTIFTPAGSVPYVVDAPGPSLAAQNASATNAGECSTTRLA